MYIIFYIVVRFGPFSGNGTGSLSQAGPAKHYLKKNSFYFKRVGKWEDKTSYYSAAVPEQQQSGLGTQIPWHWHRGCRQ